MNFSDLGLSDAVLRAVEDAGYTTPTPIQEQAIPQILMGRDVLGCAQTGTGKTAGFTLPMIEILAAGRAKARMPRSLILEPTRELAAQVADNFTTYGKYNKLTKALLIGGVSLDDQIKVVDRGVDVLIATPGRLLDLFDRGRLLMNDVRIVVIDEADRMLDMGFIPDVERIVSLVPKIRQTLFFSATMPPEIRKLGEKFLMNPKEVSVAPQSTAAATVTQGLVIVSHSDGRRQGGGQKEKRDALRRLIRGEAVKNALIFCNRKRDVGVVCRSLQRHGFDASQLHGDMTQPARMETLDKFKKDEITLLVCSDVAARGLDIVNMSHVFNYDVPVAAEDYIHRIGRTGRAGREGRAYTIATKEDTKYIDSIEKMLGKKIPLIPLDGIEVIADANIPVIADVETPGNDGAKHGRRRRRGKSERPAETITKTSAPAKEDSTPREDREERKEPPREIRQERYREEPRRESRGRDHDDGPSVVGLGDHVPAFMTRKPTGNLVE